MINSAISFSKETNWAFFAFFIVSFVFMKSVDGAEYFGVGLFSFIYLMYSLFAGKGVLDFFMVSNLKTETRLNLWMVFFSLVMGIAAIIMLILTLLKIKGLFEQDNSPIQLSSANHKKLQDIETIFITATVALGVACTYLFYDTESIYTTVFGLIKGTTSNFGKVMGLFMAVIAFAVGSALYKKLDDRCDSDEIQPFKIHFRYTYWFVFAMFLLMVGRRFVEAYLFPMWRYNFGWLLNNPKVGFIPYLHWDVFLDLAKWFLSVAALVYASLTIRDYMKLDNRDGCFKYGLRDYYVTFIVMLMIFFSMYILSPNHLTELFTFVARYCVPVGLLAMTAYLVYATNDLANLSRSELVK